jgi:Ca2+-binding RTX toxin-like protein
MTATTVCTAATGTTGSTARGADLRRGGSGADRLRGGAGRDMLSGTGQDGLHGGCGRDRWSARGGGRGRVNCGKGRDTVRADAPARLRGCEPIRSLLASPLRLLSTDAHRRRWRSAAPAYSRHAVVVVREQPEGLEHDADVAPDVIGSVCSEVISSPSSRMRLPLSGSGAVRARCEATASRFSATASRLVVVACAQRP